MLVVMPDSWVIVVVVVAVQVPVHEAHAYCPCTRLTLRVIEVVIIHIVSRSPVVRVWCWLLPYPAVWLRSRVNFILIRSKRWTASK